MKAPTPKHFGGLEWKDWVSMYLAPSTFWGGNYAPLSNKERFARW
jgi:hypothetical protein